MIAGASRAALPRALHDTRELERRAEGSSGLNDAYCVVVGEVQSRPDDGFEVVMDVVVVVWEPLPEAPGG